MVVRTEMGPAETDRAQQLGGRVGGDIGQRLSSATVPFKLLDLRLQILRDFCFPDIRLRKPGRRFEVE
jgi:hypothetical protein